MAKKYFSVHQSNPLPEVKPRTEVEQNGVRNIVLQPPAKKLQSNSEVHEQDSKRKKL